MIAMAITNSSREETTIFSSNLWPQETPLTQETTRLSHTGLHHRGGQLVEQHQHRQLGDGHQRHDQQDHHRGRAQAVFDQHAGAQHHLRHRAGSLAQARDDFNDLTHSGLTGASA